ncbi:hypothetical protein B0H13DRAFT_2275840 [Mycena leptocephala]|nr:hypothetical protein B0H13DRAFT_2275840 [Mycena leptocephala]
MASSYPFTKHILVVALVLLTPGSYTFTSPEKLAKKLLDKIYDDIDTSSISKTHLALAITFAIYNVLPLLPVLRELSKRVGGGRVPKRDKEDVARKSSGVLLLSFVFTLLVWLVYYVTEAATAGGKGVIITTFENYRFTTAQRYASLALSDLAVLVMLLYLVNLRLTRVPRILFWLSFILIITVYACMLSISPSNPRSLSIAEAARILRHIETGIYLVLVVLVTRTTWKLHRAISSARLTVFHRSLHASTPRPQYAYTRFLPLLWIRTLVYLTFYILVYIPVTLKIRYDILYVVNLAVSSSLCQWGKNIGRGSSNCGRQPRNLNSRSDTGGERRGTLCSLLQPFKQVRLNHIDAKITRQERKVSADPNEPACL